MSILFSIFSNQANKFLKSLEFCSKNSYTPEFPEDEFLDYLAYGFVFGLMTEKYSFSIF